MDGVLFPVNPVCCVAYYNPHDMKLLEDVECMQQLCYVITMEDKSFYIIPLVIMLICQCFYGFLIVVARDAWSI